METKLEIVMNENGEVSISGPIGNKLICYSMLELARDAIKDHHDKARSAKIAIVGSMPEENRR